MTVSPCWYDDPSVVLQVTVGRFESVRAVL